MKTLGFELKKGELRFSVLSGTLALPQYISHGRRVFHPDASRPDLMSWFKKNFVEIINDCGPDRVAYRVSLNANSVAQVSYLLFPWGVLNLVLFERGIPASEFNKMSFTPKRFGFPKGVKPEDQVDVSFGVKAPHWDGPQKISILAAWAALDS